MHIDICKLRLITGLRIMPPGEFRAAA